MNRNGYLNEILDVSHSFDREESLSSFDADVPNEEYDDKLPKNNSELIGNKIKQFSPTSCAAPTPSIMTVNQEYLMRNLN
jgi:hypothetical protein